jgi:hypothetical protein
VGERGRYGGKEGQGGASSERVEERRAQGKDEENKRVFFLWAEKRK